MPRSRVPVLFAKHARAHHLLSRSCGVRHDARSVATVNSERVASPAEGLRLQGGASQ